MVSNEVTDWAKMKARGIERCHRKMMKYVSQLEDRYSLHEVTEPENNWSFRMVLDANGAGPTSEEIIITLEKFIALRPVKEAPKKEAAPKKVKAEKKEEPAEVKLVAVEEEAKPKEAAPTVKPPAKRSHHKKKAEA
jgi:hypothetical protein